MLSDLYSAHSGFYHVCFQFYFYRCFFFLNRNKNKLKRSWIIKIGKVYERLILNLKLSFSLSLTFRWKCYKVFILFFCSLFQYFIYKIDSIFKVVISLNKFLLEKKCVINYFWFFFHFVTDYLSHCIFISSLPYCLSVRLDID